jgi:hypothetical protein
MTQENSVRKPSWFYAALSVAALLIAASVAYRVVYHVEREWIQLDKQGTGEWARSELVVPRLFDSRTGESCEYRGAGVQIDLVSQFIRGPWVCFPGPSTK